jgi:hypothetical protein
MSCTSVYAKHECNSLVPNAIPAHSDQLILKLTEETNALLAKQLAGKPSDAYIKYPITLAVTRFAEPTGFHLYSTPLRCKNGIVITFKGFIPGNKIPSHAKGDKVNLLYRSVAIRRNGLSNQYIVTLKR